jgi:hypothetical protein
MSLPTPSSHNHNLGKILNLERNPKIASLFNHPKFNSRISSESDVIQTDPKTLLQVYARRAIDFWYECGLPHPLKKTLKSSEETAMSGFVAVMKGEHPFLPFGKKITLEEIYESIKNLKIARSDYKYEPMTKTNLKKVRLSRFVYDKWTGKSLLVKYLNPPKFILKEKNPRLTQLLMHHFANAKWGTTAKDIEHEHRFSFLCASNRVMKYLVEHQNEFEPLMKLSPLNPKDAARGLIACAQQSGNWNNFDPKWLSNDLSIGKLDIWLRNQGFFKHTNFKSV